MEFPRHEKSPLPRHDISMWIQVFKSSDYLTSSTADKLDCNCEKNTIIYWYKKNSENKGNGSFLRAQFNRRLVFMPQKAL